MIQILFSLALAASSTTRLIQTEEYSFEVPAEWALSNPKAKESSMLGIWHSANRSVVLNLMKTDATSLAARESCAAFTEKMLGSTHRKNLLPDDQKKLTTEALIRSNAQEAFQSMIEVNSKGTNKGDAFPIQQKSLCLKDSKNIWMLTGTYPKKKGPQIVDSIFSSFQLKAHK